MPRGHKGNPTVHSNSSYGADTIKQIELKSLNLSENEKVIFNRLISNEFKMTDYLKSDLILKYHEVPQLVDKRGKLSKDLTSILLMALLLNFKELKNYGHNRSMFEQMQIYQLIKMLNLKNKDMFIEQLDLQYMMNFDKEIEQVYKSPESRRFYKNMKDYLEPGLFVYMYPFTNMLYRFLLIFNEYDSTFILYDYDNFHNFAHTWFDFRKMRKIFEEFNQTGLTDALLKRDYKSLYEIYQKHFATKKASNFPAPSNLRNRLLTPRFFAILKYYLNKPIDEIPPFVALILLSVAQSKLIHKEGKYYLTNETEPFKPLEYPYDCIDNFLEKYHKEVLSHLDPHKPLLENLLNLVYYETKMLYHPLTSEQKEEIKTFVNDILNKCQKYHYLCNTVAKKYDKYPELFNQYIDYIKIKKIASDLDYSRLIGDEFERAEAFISQFKNLLHKRKLSTKEVFTIKWAITEV